MSTLNVDKVDPNTGTALELGTSGDTITVPTGAGLTVVDEVKTNKVSPATGTAFALGDSGDTFTVPSGATIVNSGTATGFGITQSNFIPNAQPLIINGDMGVAQRGTSATGKTNGDTGYYTVDRIQFAESGTMTAVITNTQESLSSGNAFNNGFEKAYKIDVTTADASAAIDILHRIKYNFEAQAVQAFKFGKTDAQPMTLAFWVKATKTGTNTVHIERGDSARSCAQEYTVSVSDTWEHKVLNFPADTTGNMPYDSGEGLNIQWNLVAGTNYTSGTLATTWESTNNPDIAVGQVNNFDSTSNNFHITAMQLEVGTYTSATIPPFQFESYGDNLARCQRYFQLIQTVSGGVSNTTSVYVNAPFFKVMRTTPSFGVQGVFYINDTENNKVQSSGAVTLHDGNEYGAFLQMDNFSSLTDTRPVMSRFLNSNKIQASAEL